jgi:hypothetical protein
MADPIIQDASENMPPVAIVEAPQDAPATRTYTLADVAIDWKVKWWGFELSFNQAAVELLDDLYDEIGQVLDHFLKEPFKFLVAAAILRKRIRLHRVTKNTGYQGCRLVSPWISPMGLTVIRNKPKEDLSLYTSVWDPSSQAWGEESAFTDLESACGPALAQYGDRLYCYGDRLYCVYRGKGDDYNMYWMTYTSDDGWNDGSTEDPENERPKRFPAHKTEQNPALVVYNDTLYCFHRGGHNDEALWFCTFNIQNNTWNPDTRIDIKDVNSKCGPSAVVFNNKLYVFFAANHYGNEIAYVSTGDGHTWSSFATISDGCDGNKDKHLTCDTPAVAVYRDQLYVAHRGNSDEKLYYCIGSSNGSGGVTWTVDIYLGNHLAEQGPALAVFKDKLVMVHRSSGKDGSLWCCYYDGSSWSADTKFKNEQQTGDTPALVSYLDPNATTENYVDPNYAGPSLIAVYRGK